MKKSRKSLIQRTNAAGCAVLVLAWSSILLAAGMLALAISYGTEWGQEKIPQTILGVAATALLGSVVALSFVGLGLLRQRRAQHGIELNLEDMSKSESWQQTLEVIGPCPVSLGMTEASLGWGKLVEAIEHLRQELQLRESHEQLDKQRTGFDALQLNQLLDAMPDGIILADNSGAVILANRACEGKLGKVQEEILGKSLGELFGGEEAQEALGCLLASGSLTAEISFDLRVRAVPVGNDTDADGEQPTVVGGDEDQTILRVFGRQVSHASDSGDVMLIIRDITQQEISRASRDEFIAHVSHEFRSPLTNIRAYTETLLSDMVLDADAQKEAFNVINEETGRLTRLVNEVLDLSRMESGSLTLDKGPVVLDRLVRQCVGDLSAMAQSRQITIQTNYHPKLPNIVADREKLAVVINNIVSNAIKYTPQGGTVFVETGCDERFVSIKITDTGYGIGADDLTRIFEKFYRVERAETADVAGTGLGLAASKEIVTLHGGSINVSSELNKGTEMLVKIPLTEAGPVLGPSVANS